MKTPLDRYEPQYDADDPHTFNGMGIDPCGNWHLRSDVENLLASVPAPAVECAAPDFSGNQCRNCGQGNAAHVAASLPPTLESGKVTFATTTVNGPSVAGPSTGNLSTMGVWPQVSVQPTLEPQKAESAFEASEESPATLGDMVRRMRLSAESFSVEGETQVLRWADEIAAALLSVSATAESEKPDFLKQAALMSGCAWKCHSKYVEQGFIACCSSCQRICNALEDAYDAGRASSAPPVSAEPDSLRLRILDLRANYWNSMAPEDQQRQEYIITRFVQALDAALAPPPSPAQEEK